jgi:chaperone modulatory protein CbpM
MAMTLELTHAVMLDAAQVCELEHLIEVSGLTPDEMDDLVENGLVAPSAAQPAPRVFHLVHVVTVLRARRLRDDFELDRNGLTLAMTLLRRIDELEQKLAAAGGAP